jgi:hypothetical protein
MSYTNPNQMPSSYNPAPGRPQSQPQAGSNGRWLPYATQSREFTTQSREFTEFSHASPNEIMNMENGALLMAMNSPAMSPNNGTSGLQTGTTNAGNVGVGGAAAAAAVGNKGDDNDYGNSPHALRDFSTRSAAIHHKMPRPIGTERASWKYGGTSGSNVGGNLDNADIGQQQMPPWLLEKNQLQSQPLSQQQQQQQQQPWMQYPMTRNHFVDELHVQDPYQQIPMDYYNSMPPQNQQPPMMQQSMHYTQMVPPEIGQQQDLWDHDKHGWSKWTN